ncbi:MAG: efflux RND transporter permease subunit, partial [Actinomycetota bacterium]
TSLGQMNQITRQLVDELSARPGVGNVGAHVGRAITSDQLVNVNEGEIWVSIAPDADYDATLSAIEEVASGNTQISSDVLTYSEQRITTVLQGRREEVVVRVYGQEPAVLEAQAEEVRSMMAAISGIGEPQVQLPANEPIIEVEVDLDRAQAAGIKPGDVRRAAAVLLSGITVGNLFEEQKVFDVVVWGTPAIRQTEDDVRNLLIDTPTGEHVRVGEVADVRVVPRPTVIRHESVERYLDVAAGVNGRSLNDVLAEVDRGLAGMEFAYEYHAELLSAPAEQRAAQGQLALVTLAVIIGVLLLLQAAFSSWRLALLAFLTLPVALAGGVLALLLDGRTLRLGSLAGFLAIIGFTTRNGIAMIKRYQRLEREGVIFGPEVVNQGTRELGGSILITAIATAVVIIPMAVMGNRAGLEIVQPMALVMFGGLVTSTLVALLVLPALYLRFGFVSEPDLSSEELAGDITGIPDLKGAEVRP